MPILRFAARGTVAYDASSVESASRGPALSSSHRSRRTPTLTRALATVAAVLVGAVVVPAGTARGEASLDDLRDRLDAAERRADEVVAERAAVEAELYPLADEIRRLELDVEARQARVRDLSDVALDRALDVYTGSSVSSVDVFEAATLLESGRRSKLLAIVNSRDYEAMNRLEVEASDLREEQKRLTEKQREAEAKRAHLEEQQSAIERELEIAQAAYEDLRDEIARQQAEAARRQEQEAAARARESLVAPVRETVTTVSPTVTTQIETVTTVPPTVTTAPAPVSEIAASSDPARISCPVRGAVSFTDTWGAPRSGGRTHQGTDIFAARGTPNVAVVSGFASQRTGGLGGNSVWLTGDDGNVYYYAHLDDFGAGGQVSQGDVVGTTGDTGNAVGTGTHTHFEIRPGGGSPVNPYPTLSSVC